MDATRSSERSCLARNASIRWVGSAAAEHDGTQSPRDHETGSRSRAPVCLSLLLDGIGSYRPTCRPDAPTMPPCSADPFQFPIEDDATTIRFAGVLRDGASRVRTGDLLLAKQALSQLSYGPVAPASLTPAVRPIGQAPRASSRPRAPRSGTPPSATRTTSGRPARRSRLAAKAARMPAAHATAVVRPRWGSDDRLDVTQPVERHVVGAGDVARDPLARLADVDEVDGLVAQPVGELRRDPRSRPRPPEGSLSPGLAVGEGTPAELPEADRLQARTPSGAPRRRSWRRSRSRSVGLERPAGAGADARRAAGQVDRVPPGGRRRTRRERGCRARSHRPRAARAARGRAGAAGSGGEAPADRRLSSTIRSMFGGREGRLHGEPVDELVLVHPQQRVVTPLEPDRGARLAAEAGAAAQRAADVGGPHLDVVVRGQHPPQAGVQLVRALGGLARRGPDGRRRPPAVSRRSAASTARAPRLTGRRRRT